MEKTLYIDFETRSFCDIKKCGSWIYSKDPSTEIILMGWRFNTTAPGKVNLWRGISKEGETQPFPTELKKFKGPIVAHNYKFEYSIIYNILAAKKLLPPSYKDLTRYKCTSARAYRCGIPGALGKAARFLKLESGKYVDEGQYLINRYSVPKKDRKTGKLKYIEITENDWRKWAAYNTQDVLLTEKFYKNLTGNNIKFENDLFELDKKINFHGLQIDIKVLNKLKKAYTIYFKKAEKLGKKLAGVEESGTPTIKSAAGFKNWLNERLPVIYRIQNVQQHTLKELEKVMAGTKIYGGAPEILQALKLRRVLSASAPKKLEAFMGYHDENGIVREYLQYYGAHTGRWAGRGFQPQNLPRDCINDDKQYKERVELLSGGKIKIEDSADTINLLIRGLIVPRKNKKNHSRFLVGDLSAIEARVIFWLAGCEKVLKAYENGKDVYIKMAQKIYNTGDIDRDKRFLGKTAILGLGFGMGDKRFRDTCALYGIDISDTFSKQVVNIYRSIFPEVPALWRNLEKAFKKAMEGKKEIRYKNFVLKKMKDKIQIQLPSGRSLYYWEPRIDNGELIYKSPDKKVGHLWGGVLVENVVQAIARDVVGEMALECDRQPDFSIVLTVHDEIIVETPAHKAKKNLKKFEEIMSQTPDWAPGLPVASECEIKKRYGK